MRVLGEMKRSRRNTLTVISNAHIFIRLLTKITITSRPSCAFFHSSSTWQERNVGLLLMCDRSAATRVTIVATSYQACAQMKIICSARKAKILYVPTRHTHPSWSKSAGRCFNENKQITTERGTSAPHLLMRSMRSTTAMMNCVLCSRANRDQLSTSL